VRGRSGARARVPSSRYSPEPHSVGYAQYRQGSITMLSTGSAASWPWKKEIAPDASDTLLARTASPCAR